MAGTFALFSLLPPEIRFQIWKQAFPPDPIWVIKWSPDRTIRITTIGTSLHTVGAACREARQLLKEKYPHPIRGIRHIALWADMKTAIFVIIRKNDGEDNQHFPSHLMTMEMRRSFFRQLHHVVIEFRSGAQCNEATRGLARLCPQITSLSVMLCQYERTETQWSEPGSVYPVLDEAAAARFRAARDSEQAIVEPGPDVIPSVTPSGRQTFLRYHSDPKFHLLNFQPPGPDPDWRTEFRGFAFHGVQAPPAPCPLWIIP